jgi:hypothetical protein
LVKSFAAVATTNVCLVVAWNWRSYDMLGKSLAALLLVYLATVPAVATWGKMETKRIQWSNLMPAYMFLMLATMLFGMRVR